MTKTAQHDGQRQNELIAEAKQYLTNNYKQQPVVFVRGEGCWLWDLAGTRYLDMTAGIAVVCLGHGHAKLAGAIAAQAARVIHVSNLYYVEPAIRLAQTLVARSFADRAFFCNSGAEANEAALKLARRWQAIVRGRPDRVEIVAFEGSFHGRTFATVAVTGQEKYRAGFGPLVEPVRLIPYGETAAVREVITEHTCAVIVEPVQGEGGVVAAPRAFLEALRQRCDATGTVLVFDEVQTGMGRTGTLFAYEQFGVVPDVMTLAKGIAGGVPMGAMLAREEIARGFEPGTHASTFGGNALACAAALAVLDVFEQEAVLENCRAAGEYLGRSLDRLARKHAGRIKEARGMGLLRGLVLDEEAAPLVGRCRERGLLLSAAGGSVLRFAPPLVVGRVEIDVAVDILDTILGEG
jgi:predicted acetylornithine/succinylornithine family transaminase